MMQVPDHAQFARRLGRNERELLLTAYEGRRGWQVVEGIDTILRPYSLVAARGPHLSAFGLKVRRALLDMQVTQ
ncbi:hypothetical protein HNO88_002980 [Novosphingobium chloroacetimidivorans]|uniref:Uncharacterized protein n=1 Tax=Novosphingobium chloroacetimidivorans TaxID=1428314 RepID=A0A7W7KBW9_9SPHN|nr:hypothetical protein [Novosphingobium chloroacetimidivorans]MBB4859651.1 hypothetical protein [Novosphingobium chloroacetimidivorans]